MNSLRLLWIIFAFLLNSFPSDSAEFQNLNFEQATIPPTSPEAFGTVPADANATFPGWTVGAGVTIHNNLTLGTPAQVLVGPEFYGINLNPLEGVYSALIQFALSLNWEDPRSPRLASFLQTPARSLFSFHPQ